MTVDSDGDSTFTSEGDNREEGGPEEGSVESENGDDSNGDKASARS